MSPALIFSAANTLAMVSWLMLAVFYRRPWVTNMLVGRAVPVVFAALYAGIVASTFAGAAGSFATLDGVATLFSQPWLLLAGWVHYLAFDLLIGTWEVNDARERQVPRLVLVPCLFLTFLFGPMGWLLYLGVRARRWS